MISLPLNTGPQRNSRRITRRSRCNLPLEKDRQIKGICASVIQTFTRITGE